MLKHSKLLFGSLAILGAIFVALFFTLFYWRNTWSFEILPVETFLSSSGLNFLLEFSLIGGTGFLAVGLLGFGRRFVKNRKTLFTVLTALLVPLLVLGGLVSLDNFIKSTYVDFLPPEKVAVTNFSLDSTNPLSFSVNAKSSCRYVVRFDSAFIEDSNQTVVASINSEWVKANDSSGNTYSTINSMYRLPPGAEQTLTFDFNTTLPTGNYTFWLCSHSNSFFSFNFALS